MEDSNEYAVPVEEAIERLAVHKSGEGDEVELSVHTFIQSGMMLIGADWSLESARDLMELHGVEEAGDQASAMGHGLATIRPDLGPVFFETKPKEKEE